MKILSAVSSVLGKHKCDLRIIQCLRSFSSSEEIRNTFIDFFTNKHEHTFIPSSKVFSDTDKTLLFVNAGMNQFKPILLGNTDSHADFGVVHRAVNSQRCIRVGGKHNDLDVVGTDCHHHTFFEMLGSWSFGDYFKREACEMAWKLLTQKFNLPVNNLYVTYFEGSREMNLEPDLETRDIWLSLGVAEDRLLPFGAKHNFWEMGDFGPCGPSTEIHFDQVGNRFAPEAVNVDGSSVIEIWNLVFTQYNKMGPNHIEVLDKFHVDTGMGLERITAVLQGKQSNYDTDLFQPIISKLESMTNCRPYNGKMGECDVGNIDTAYRIISDHIRMLTVAIADGLIPGPKKRDLMLRHMLRRAVSVGHNCLHLPPMFMSSLVPIVVDKLKSIHPDLLKKQMFVTNIIDNAEKEFYDLLKRGDDTVKRTVSKLASSNKQFPTETAIYLTDYLGYPKDRLLSQVNNYSKTVDVVKIDQHFVDILPKQQQKISAKKHNDHQLYEAFLHSLSSSKFSKTRPILRSKYENIADDLVFESISAKVVAFFDKTGKKMNVLSNNDNDHVYLLLDKTCFVHPNGEPLAHVGKIQFSDETSCDIMGVIHIQNWILHKASLTIPPTTQIMVDDAVKLNATTHYWLPLVRSFEGASILLNFLPDAAIHKVAYEPDKFIVELSGTMNTATLLKLERDVNAFICGDHDLRENNSSRLSPSDVISFVIVKHRQQGKSRTILHCVTGFRAKNCGEVAKDLQLTINAVSKQYDELSSVRTDDWDIFLKKVGRLNYDSNKSEYNAVAKAENKKYFMSLSSKLNSMKRKLKAKKK